MSEEAIVVRSPTPADGPGMGLVHVLAWQVGYRGLMPDEFLRGLDPEQRGENWTAGLTRIAEAGGVAAGQATPVVAEVDGGVAGIGLYGPYRRDEGVPTEGADELSELWMLNVHPDHWGTGVAQALMAHMVAHLGDDHPEPKAALWVLEGNARGRRFYEKVGWSEDGITKSERIGETELVELRYVLNL